MKNLKGILFVAAIVALLMSVNTMASSNSILLQEVNDTTIKRAVFGAFLSDIDAAGVQSAITITNCTETKDELSGLIGDRDGSGAFHIYLWNRDGELIQHNSGAVGGNQGEGWDGLLGPGETWTALLGEILDEAGFSGDTFQGYAWVCSDFDCLAGTYTVTAFSVGFSQAFEFLPGMGQGGNFGGIPLP